ncbi:MAG: FAD:protein FMN transferase [bacterium]|nr:FAD:protein FMN transferase [bacterium]
MNRRAFAVGSAVIFISLLLGGVAFLQKKRPVRLFESRLHLGTMVDLDADFPDRETGRKAMAAAWGEIERLEQSLSERRADSEIARINRNAGISRVQVGPSTLEVIRMALEFSRRSGGAFDPTWAALAFDPRGWRIDPNQPRVPSPEDLRLILPRVDYRKVRISESESWVFLPEPGMVLGLGGIAKGYIVDRAVRELESRGAIAGIVNGGGDLRVFGKPRSGKAWRIGVRDPFHPDRILARVPVTQGAVATSGNYERAMVVNGIRYHHIFDPHTGWPARGLAQVTIAAPAAVTAEAAALSVFVLGKEKGREFLKGFPGNEGILIGEDGERWMTSGWKNRVEFPDGQARDIDP